MVLLGLMGATSVVPQSKLPELGEILAKNANLSTYYELLKVCSLYSATLLFQSSPRRQKYPNLLLQLPNIQGLTVSTP